MNFTAFSITIYSSQQSQSVKHFIRQITEVIISVKPPAKIPTKIARITLVAAKVTAKSIIPAKRVRTIPVSICGTALQIQQSLKRLIPTEVRSKTARNTAATPSATQKNGVATVIIAVKLNIATIIPTKTLAAMLISAQSNFVLQLQLVIFFTSVTLYEIFIKRVNND